MEYAQYYLVPRAEVAKLGGVVDDEKVQTGSKGDRWAMVITYESKVPELVSVAIDFNNDEWSAWGFTVYQAGAEVCSGLFGENAESGVDIEDNKLDGDLDAMAEALGVDGKKLKKILRADFPDIEAFAKLVKFPIFPVTPMDFDED